MAHSIGIHVKVDGAILRGSRNNKLGTIVRKAMEGDALDATGAPRAGTLGKVVESLIDTTKNELQVDEIVDGVGRIALVALNPLDAPTEALGAWLKHDDMSSEAEKKGALRALSARISMHATTQQGKDKQGQGGAAAGHASLGGIALYELAEIVVKGLDGVGQFSGVLAQALAKAAVFGTCKLVVVEEESSTKVLFVVADAASIKTAFTQPTGKGEKDLAQLKETLVKMAPVEIGLNEILNMTNTKFKQDLLDRVLGQVKNKETPTIKEMTGAKTPRTVASAIAQTTMRYTANDGLTTSARRAKEASASWNCASPCRTYSHRASFCASCRRASSR